LSQWSKEIDRCAKPSTATLEGSDRVPKSAASGVWGEAELFDAMSEAEAIPDLPRRRL